MAAGAAHLALAIVALALGSCGSSSTHLCPLLVAVPPDAFILCFWTARDAVLFSIDVQQVRAARKTALQPYCRCWPTCAALQGRCRECRVTQGFRVGWKGFRGYVF